MGRQLEEKCLASHNGKLDTSCYIHLYFLTLFQRLSQSQSLTCQLQCVLHKQSFRKISVLERIRWQLQPTRGDVAMSWSNPWLVDDSLTRCFHFDTLTAWIRTAHDSRIVGPPDSTIFFSDLKNERLGDSPPEDQLRLLKFGTMKF